MVIKQFIRTDYPTIPTHVRMSDAYEQVQSNHCTIVLNEDGSVAGLLSRADVMRHRSGLIRDQPIKKPRISPEHKVRAVVAKMLAEAVEVLPVYDGEEFKGAVSIHDITSDLLDHLSQEKVVFNTVIHDLRNSLTNLMSLNELLQENVRKPENLEIIELIRQSCTHALNVVQELLFVENLYKRERFVQETELNQFIAESISELKGVTAAKGITVSFDLAREPFMYPIDRTHFKRAIHNLASNAVKFSQRNGLVRIISTISGPTLRIQIEDEGVGIPLSAQPFIFDEFSSASKKGTEGELSTGLGLFFSKACIEQLGGTLQFESTEGNGTAFTIEFTRKA